MRPYAVALVAYPRADPDKKKALRFYRLTILVLSTIKDTCIQ